MSTWTCQCGEMNAGALTKCRCGQWREPSTTGLWKCRCGATNLVGDAQCSRCAMERRGDGPEGTKATTISNRSESPKSSRKAMTPEERLNKTERAFLEYLKLRWDKIGIQSITLRLAWGVRYTPDFWTKSNDTLHFWEVKGFMRDDARKSLMFAAKEYPWAIFWLVKRDKSQPNGWLITEVQR